MSTISEAIQQPSFESPRQRALVNVLYTAGWAKSEVGQVLKPFGLTWQQFNCLRILRGQRGEPASMRLIAERMLDPQSNASRLVDKLMDKRWVVRVTCPEDRRQVRVSLTAEGATALEACSTAVKEYYDGLGATLTDEEVRTLSDLLDRMRAT